MSDTPWSGWCVPGSATTWLLPAAGGGKTQWFHPDLEVVDVKNVCLESWMCSFSLLLLLLLLCYK